jgi:Cys-tRNA(Pro) deacylase
MAKDKIPVTPAVRMLRAHKAAFTPHLYQYQDHGGTKLAARELGVEEHRTIKTLIMKSQANDPLIVLMHGDREVSTKSLARILGVKSIDPCDAEEANRLTGYQVGGISPFGTRHRLPVYMEASIAELPVIYINGGKRGFLLEMSPSERIRVLEPTPVNTAID